MMRERVQQAAAQQDPRGQACSLQPTVATAVAVLSAVAVPPARPPHPAACADWQCTCWPSVDARRAATAQRTGPCMRILFVQPLPACQREADSRPPLMEASTLVAALATACATACEGVQRSRLGLRRGRRYCAVACSCHCWPGTVPALHFAALFPPSHCTPFQTRPLKRTSALCRATWSQLWVGSRAAHLANASVTVAATWGSSAEADAVEVTWAVQGPASGFSGWAALGLMPTPRRRTATTSRCMLEASSERSRWLQGNTMEG